MDKSRSLAATALSTLIGLSAGLAADDANAQASSGNEKCYGVVKKGQNDCGTANHGCSKQASEDADPNEWVYLPKGSCEKIVGGSLEPKDK